MTLIDNPTRSKIKKIHFIGIGGSGMSGIAEVLANLGYEISGSDIQSNTATKKLEKLGCSISYKQQAKNVIGKQAIVVSSAIDKNNPELQEARQQKLLIVPRAEMLAELMAVVGMANQTNALANGLQIEVDTAFKQGGLKA